MSSTFPQLLKRSAFASHDALITRVYASTPQSAAIGDWGLKSPIHRTKGSRYIRVAELDSEMGIGATWSSAETEARMMNMWGDGSIPWDGKSKRPVRASMKTDFDFAEDLPESPVAQLLPNVESMTKPEFERYLAHVRKHRQQLRESLHAEGGRANGSAPDESTLTHAAAKGHVRDSDSADFQNTLITSELTKEGSQRLQARPHRLHGLAYSPAPSNNPNLDPSRAHKGRVLDRAERGYASSFRDGTNSKWVVGLGGVTATAASGTNRIADKASLSQFDYKRARPDAGVAHFGVKEATLKAPPRVIGLNAKTEGGQVWTDLHTSTAYRPAPLKSFRFDIDVQEVPAPENAVELGSADWVARERSRATTSSMEGELGVLGSRRSNRTRGGGANAAVRLSQQMASANIDSLLAKLQTLKKQ